MFFGTEACSNSIEKKKIKLLLIANDSSERTKNNFYNICNKHNIPIKEVLATEEISLAVGKTNKVVIGITDINFSKAILNIIDGGEIIG